MSQNDMLTLAHRLARVGRNECINKSQFVDGLEYEKRTKQTRFRARTPCADKRNFARNGDDEAR